MRPQLLPLLPSAAESEWLYQQAEDMRRAWIGGEARRSAYKAGRTDDWLKTKTPHGQEVERKRFDRGSNSALETVDAKHGP